MARRGRFGRRPNGGGGNLAALIASLIREQRAQQDRAIFDAYNNGGMFEGKSVTDQRLLDYITTRRDQFAKDDPLWDQWNNSFIQQKFTIGEQKIGLLYKQGKASASAVAAFYRSQLDSIPKDSAFYREVAGRAAEWAKAAKAASGGGGGGSGGGSNKKSIYAAYQASQDGVQAAEFANDAVEFAIRQALARDGYSISNSQPVMSVGATLVAELFNSGKVVYQGATLSLDDYHQITTNLDTAYGTAIKAYKAAGYNYAEIGRKRMAFQQETFTKIDTLPYQQRAEAIYSVLNDQLEAAQGEPGAVAKAYEAAARLMTGLSSEAAKAGIDPDIAGALANDVLTLSGKPAKGDSMLDILTYQRGQTGRDEWAFLTPAPDAPNGTTPSSSTADDINYTFDQQKLLAKGGYLMQQADGAVTVVDPAVTPKGAVPAEWQATIINIDGVPTQVYLHGTPVVTASEKDKNGNTLYGATGGPTTTSYEQGDNNAVVGLKFTWKNDGVTMTSWAVKQTIMVGGKPTTQFKFFDHDPFLGETSVGKNGEIIVGKPLLAGQPLDYNDLLSEETWKTGTDSLVIDKTAQAAVTANPNRAYDLFVNGKIDAETLTRALGSDPTTTTPEMAVALLQSAKAIAGPNLETRSESAGIQRAVSQQGQSLAQSIIGNLVALPADKKIVGPYGPQAAMLPPINWTQATITNQQAAFAVRDTEAPPKLPSAPAPTPTYTGVVQPTPAPITSTALKAPTTSGISYTGIPTAPVIKTAPTTTKIGTGQYSGKIIPI